MKKVGTLTPQYTFVMAAVFAAAAIFVCVLLILRAPWMGVVLDPEPANVGVVLSVDEAAAAAGIRVGDRVLGFSAKGREPVYLYPLSLVSDPDQAGNFAGLTALFDHVAQLHDVARQPQVNLHLEDDRVIALATSARPLRSLPLWMWLMAAGVVPFLVGAGVWSYRRGDLACQMLLLAGASFMGIALSNLVYAYRQPSVQPLLFEVSVYINRLSTLLFFFAYLAVFWVYPRRLGSTRILWVGFVVVVLLFANELTRTLDWPGDTFAFPVVISLPLTFLVIAIQWRLSRRSPVDRAALQWFVLVMMTGMLLVTALYFFPALVGAAPVMSLEVAFGVGIVSYLGLIMAVVRYRLFQLGEWWLTAWLWLLGGSAVVLLDLLIAYLLNVAPTYVIALSIFIIGWIYFPVRQWLWRRLFWQGTEPMSWLPRQLLESLVSAQDDRSLNDNWRVLLRKLFSPMHMESDTGHLAEPRVEQEGLVLAVPNLSGEGLVRCGYRSNGRRLFSPSDAALVGSLLHMAGPAADARAATQRERERIMRDLHDDVGARLLTLSHRVQRREDRDMVKSAMQALRETIYRLKRPEGTELEEALADWRHELDERLDAAGIALDWQTVDDLPAVRLSPAQTANMGQVLREAVSNALRHGAATAITFRMYWRQGELVVALGQRGRLTDPTQWRPGTGLLSMERRIAELGGHLHWRAMADGCEMTLQIPVAPSQIRREH